MCISLVVSKALSFVSLGKRLKFYDRPTQLAICWVKITFLALIEGILSWAAARCEMQDQITCVDECRGTVEEVEPQPRIQSFC